MATSLEESRLPQGFVTFMFTDIEGSTRLWEEDPEAMRAALERHDRLAQEHIPQNRGHVVLSRGEGDSLFCVFEDPSDAVRAAIAFQRSLSSNGSSDSKLLNVRIAIHTGEAQFRDDDYYGPEVNRCARLRAIAHGGQTLLSGTALSNLRTELPEGVSLLDLGEHRLKDLQRPERVHQVVHPDLQLDFPPLNSLSALPNNLPQQLTSFIGRERETAAVAELLAASRLVTLVGSGGVGKTRLALQVAADSLRAFPEGVWIVDLAPISDHSLFSVATAGALGVREEPGRDLSGTLVEYLRPRRTLIVFDNCEHMIDPAARFIDAALKSAPNLRVLATSRKSLNVAGESTYRVPSLGLPDSASVGPESALQSEAVRLFAERASLAQPGFRITPSSADAVVQICRRLDGIPLAIELAAARCKSMTPEQIAGRLDDAFRLLTGGSRTALPRQQTLRAAIEWSYDLLGPEERVLFQRLGVFSGGWTLEASEAVGVGGAVEDWQVLDLLSSILDKSLAQPVSGQSSEGRYEMLQTVRQFALEELRRGGDAPETRTRHLDHFAALAKGAAEELRGSGQKAWLDRLELEHDNLRAALEWAVQSDPSRATAMIADLGRFWLLRGHWSEALDWVSRVPSGASNEPPPDRCRAAASSAEIALRSGSYELARNLVDEALRLSIASDDAGTQAACRCVLAELLSRNGAYETARAEAERAVELAGALEDVWLQAKAWSAVGHVDWAESKYAEAHGRYRTGLELAERTGDPAAIAASLHHLADIAWSHADYAAVRRFDEQCLAMQREIGDVAGMVSTLHDVGFTAWILGDYDAARTYAEESLSLSHRIGDPSGLAFSLLGLGLAARSQGAYDDALAKFEESLAIRQRIGDRRGAALCLNQIGLVRWASARADEALPLHHEALSIAEELHDSSGAAFSHMGLGLAHHALGDLRAAREHLDESLRLRTSIGDSHGIAYSHFGIALTLEAEANFDEAAAHALESLRLLSKIGDRRGVADCLESLARLKGASGEPVRAARLLGAANRIRDEIRSPRAASLEPLTVAAVEGLEERLGIPDFQAALLAGGSLAIDEVLAEAAAE